VGLGVGAGVGEGLGAGVGEGVGDGVGEGVGVGEALGLGVGEGLGVGVGVGLGVGEGVDEGVGVGFLSFSLSEFVSDIRYTVKARSRQAHVNKTINSRLPIHDILAGLALNNFPLSGSSIREVEVDVLCCGT